MWFFRCKIYEIGFKVDVLMFLKDIDKFVLYYCIRD